MTKNLTLYMSSVDRVTAVAELAIPNMEGKDQEDQDFITERGEIGVHKAKGLGKGDPEACPHGVLAMGGILCVQGTSQHRTHVEQKGVQGPTRCLRGS